VYKADRFWPGVTRLVVAILIVLLILAVIGMYLASMTEISG
jgi:Tfp pilus assembly protein PilO